MSDLLALVAQQTLRSYKTIGLQMERSQDAKFRLSCGKRNWKSGCDKNWKEFGIQARAVVHVKKMATQARTALATLDDPPSFVTGSPEAAITTLGGRQILQLNEDVPIVSLK